MGPDHPGAREARLQALRSRTTTTPVLELPITHKPTPTYQHRLIAFIDILGFREIVDATAEGRSTAGPRLSQLLTTLRTMRDAQNDEARRGDKQVTHFSDSLVVSYRADATSGVFDLLLDLYFIVVEALHTGVLMRGGIAMGELIHTPEVLVGPAMVKAYELESKRAGGPRVVVDEAGYQALIAQARVSPAPHHDGATESRYVEKLLRRDADGYYYLDYISFRGVVEIAGIEQENYPAHLQRISEINAAGLRHADPHIQEKHLWLHKHYRAQLREIMEHPNTDFQRNEPQLWGYYEALETLDAVAELALRPVERMRDEAKVRREADERARAEFTRAKSRAPD